MLESWYLHRSVVLLMVINVASPNAESQILMAWLVHAGKQTQQI
jgi:hypothetical protein